MPDAKIELPGAIRPIAWGDSTRVHPHSDLAGIPLPPESLMWSVGSDSLDNFLAPGRVWADLIRSFLPEHATVLDIGCGCGRVARFLIEDPRVDRYIGFDVLRENIGWCRQHLAPHWSAICELYWFDLYSAEYNPSGAEKAVQMVFPCESATADVVFAGSVFTHLLEPDAAHYLQEIRRVLSSRGVAILSIHRQPAPGTRFSGTESRIDIDPDYFVQMAAEAGLREQQRRSWDDPALQIDMIFTTNGKESAATNSLDIARLRLEALSSELIALQKAAAVSPIEEATRTDRNPRF